MRMFKLLSGRNETQRGITGLETAIILIAFVVVASVFAFTVLSTGIFASERSKETVFAGLDEVRSSLEPRGSVIAYKGRSVRHQRMTRSTRSCSPSPTPFRVSRST